MHIENRMPSVARLHSVPETGTHVVERVPFRLNDLQRIKVGYLNCAQCNSADQINIDIE
jgi:hypothetical protein